MKELGDFEDFIHSIDADAKFTRACIKLSGKLTGEQVVQTALEKGMQPQKDEWCPCSKEQADVDFGDENSAGWYIEGVFEGEHTQCFLELDGTTMWFV